MKRVSIRDNRSRRKPRFCDYVQTEDGTELIETKGNNGLKSMCLDDFFSQIDAARKTK